MIIQLTLIAKAITRMDKYVNNWDMLLFIFVMILEKIFNKRKTEEKGMQRMYIIHRFAILLIPTSSIMIVVTAFLFDYSSSATILIVSLLLGINVLVFYLYDILEGYYDDKYEKGLLKQQIKAYANQLEIKKTSDYNIKMLKHDMKNHISIMQSMLQNDKMQDLIHYMNIIYEHVNAKKEYSNSGNSDIDSVLNYKFAEAEEADAIIDVTVNVPDKLNIDLYDLNVILGNLIDNAVAAIRKSEEKGLKIEINLNRSVLYITVINSYSQQIYQKDGKFLTTKKDTKNHGIGLSSIENVLEKYNGAMDIDYNDNTFEVNVLLYNPIK
ncbi:MAG: putative rane protein [Anaerocolumna sp.]|jgi:sensor histidine kinase YesM|nr:putative rane protein [Anaerocolumna sp.]